MYISELEKTNIFKECIPLNLSESLFDRAITLTLSNSKIASYTNYPIHKEIIINKFSHLIKKYQIDLIHSNNIFMNPFLSDLSNIPKIFDAIDSHSFRFKRDLRYSSGVFEFLVNFCRFNALKIGERSVLNYFNITTVVSPKDQNYLQKLNSSADIRVIQNGVDTDYYFNKVTIKEDFPSIIFSGTMNFSPNIDAVLYIYNKILPLIRKEIPNVKFYIIGANPPIDIKKLHDGKSIIVTGFVEDIRDYICKGSVALFPMRKGSGLKNKILEAMAMERPVVTNQTGAEAFSEKIKDYLLIGNTESEIAYHVIHLLKSEFTRHKMGIRNRNIVIKEFSWQSIARNYEQIYDEILSKKFIR